MGAVPGAAGAAAGEQGARVRPRRAAAADVVRVDAGDLDVAAVRLARRRRADRPAGRRGGAPAYPAQRAAPVRRRLRALPLRRRAGRAPHAGAGRLPRGGPLERTRAGRRCHGRRTAADRARPRRVGRDEPPPLPAAQLARGGLRPVGGPGHRRAGPGRRCRRPVRRHGGGAGGAGRAAPAGGARRTRARLGLLRRHVRVRRPVRRGRAGAGRDPRRSGQGVGTFRVPLATLNRHAFVTGATGSGKSQTVRHLLEQLSRARIPWLAIEPAKSEYAAMAGRIDNPVTVINPSAPDGVPFSVNPLEPEPGYPVQAHIDMVRALFMAAFDAEEPFPQIMSLALQRVYEATGWDVVTGGAVPGSNVPPSVPTLEQLQQHAMDVIKEIGYGREVQADVEGFISLRLRSLRVGSAGRFFEGGHPADIGGLLERDVVLAIEDVANDEDKAFLMGTLIIRIVEHLRMRARKERSAELRHVIVIEEAHRLLRDRGTAAPPPTPWSCWPGCSRRSGRTGRASWWPSRSPLSSSPTWSRTRR
ncbi:ATP-binding protein [Nonomuraea antimicrobica]